MRYRVARPVIATVAALALLVSTASGTLGAGRPERQKVAYTYDASSSTVTLYTSTPVGLLNFTGATLQVDNGTPTSVPCSVTASWDANGNLSSTSTCVFTGVIAPASTLAITATIEDPPEGTGGKTYVGEFDETCRRVPDNGCTGEEMVRLSAIR